VAPTEARVTTPTRLGSTVLAALALGGGLLAPARARAQGASDVTANEADEIENDFVEGPRHYRSPQNFAFELKFGPYRPDIDSEFAKAGGATPPTPYKDYFGDGRHLLTQIEFDWQVFHRFGSLALGFGIGYFQLTGAAPLGDGTGRISGDTSTLKIIPMSVSAVYRFDYLLERYEIPLVPYGKLGLDYDYWQNTDGNNEIATDGRGGTGRGGTTGWHATAGAALVLDFFDPDAARDFDSDLGVNHTALTFEFSHADISGLGQPNRLHLGDTTWALGLLLEF
jgi:hypothetical protein